jgi:hypothetical protein
LRETLSTYILNKGICEQTFSVHLFEVEFWKLLEHEDGSLSSLKRAANLRLAAFTKVYATEKSNVFTSATCP